MRLVLGTEIAKIDSMACELCGISGLWLMENAGTAVADFADCLIKKRILDKNREILVLAGGGNNGGDALVVARLLNAKGYKTLTVVLCDPAKYKNDAKTNWDKIIDLSLPCLFVKEQKDIVYFEEKLKNTALVIDGIFGTGFHGFAKGIIADVINAVNRSKCLKLAIDLPSGINATYGTVEGPAVKADYTVTFGWEKYGTKVYPAKDFVGQTTVADIGLPVELLAKIESNITETDSEIAKNLLPVRKQESHKGTYGHVAVVGGAYGMLGAPILAAQGALKSGAGLVTVVSVEDIMIPLACNQPEIMCRLQKGKGFLSESDKDEIADFIKDKYVVMGMGMGRNPHTVDLINLLCQCEMKGLVLDADGLWALAAKKIDFGDCGFPVVLTPHPKEMAKLLDISVKDVQDNRLQTVVSASEKFGATVVLKGAKTLIANGNKVFLNSTGNCGMATGGSGDVLGGIICSFLAQGLTPEAATVLGVYIHGKSGDIAKTEVGEYGMSAGDLVKYLPKAVIAVENNR